MVRKVTKAQTGRRYRWRDYRTSTGARPLVEFFDDLDDDEAAAVVAGMKSVSRMGLGAARHLRAEIYEVRVDAPKRSFRVLFARETKFILLGLSGFVKKTQRAPVSEIELALARLKDWRSRGER